MVSLIKRLAVRFRPERVQFGAMCLERADYLKRQFDDLPAGDPRRGQLATSLLETLLDGLGGFVGNAVLQAAYAPALPAGAPREDHLSVLWWRLWVAERLFRTVEQDGDRSAIRALRAEVLAVANGDAPSLLARLPEAPTKGLSPASFKVLSAKVVLLQWKVFIKNHCAVPIPVKVFESWVKFGFGSSEANKWKGQIVKSLGQRNLDLALSLADGMRYRLPRVYDAGDVERAVKESAAALVRAERIDRAENGASRPAPEARN